MSLPVPRPVQMNDPSQPNEEGITALHNAICGANYPIVDFLIAAGAVPTVVSSRVCLDPETLPFSGLRVDAKIGERQ